MTDHPSTYRGPDGRWIGVQWDDRASLHRKDDGGGVFDGANALRRGTFAELIRHMMMLPEDDRREYVIQKAGDREYGATEIAELAAVEGFPATGETGEGEGAE